MSLYSLELFVLLSMVFVLAAIMPRPQRQPIAIPVRTARVQRQTHRQR